MSENRQLTIEDFLLKGRYISLNENRFCQNQHRVVAKLKNKKNKNKKELK